MSRSGGCAKWITGIVSSRYRGIEAGIGCQVGARDIDGIGSTGYRTGVVLAINREADGIAIGSITANRASHGYHATGFCCVNHVICGDRINRDGSTSHGINRMN